ncbi:MAG: DEAD/DEAH box helicase [Fusobacteriaceae bacterium]
MKIIRSNYLELYPESSFEYSTLKNLLNSMCVRDNPIYIKAQKSGRFTKGLTRKIQTFKEIKNGFKIYKANKAVLDALFESKIPMIFKDERVSNKIDANPTMGPRDDEQKNAIDDLYNEMVNGFGYCCLSAAPAAGKSFCAINLVTKLREKTLIIVDMKLLIDQFIETILRFSDIKADEIGLISEGKVEIDGKKLIIATAQTLIKRTELYKQLEKEIGFLIVDEVHVASSNTFQELIPKFRPMYQLGLSGSHNRDDKMEFLIQESVGPIAHEISKEKLVAAGSIITPILRPVFLQDDRKADFYRDKEIEFRDVVDYFYNCPETINKISKLVKYYYDQNRSQLLICKEKTMIEAYYDNLLKLTLPESFIAECEKELSDKINSIKKDFEEIDKMTTKDCITKKDEKDMASGKVSTKEIRKKYEDRKIKKLDAKSKELDRVLKRTWKDTETAKNNDLFNSIVIITGDINATVREDIISRANSGKIKILITSTVN